MEIRNQIGIDLLQIDRSAFKRIAPIDPKIEQTNTQPSPSPFRLARVQVLLLPTAHLNYVLPVVYDVLYNVLVSVYDVLV